MKPEVLDLLAFYQRELAELAEGREVLARLGVTDPAVAAHFKLGYASGKALRAMSEQQHAALKAEGLAYRRQERMAGAIVVPVYNLAGELVDMFGAKPYEKKTVLYGWQKPGRGLMGIEAARVYSEVILCDNPVHALQARQHGYENVLSLFKTKLDKTGRREAQLREHLEILDELGVRRVYLVSRQHRSELGAILEGAGFSVIPVHFPNDETVLPKASLDAVVLQKKRAEGQGETGAILETPEALELVSRTENRLTFRAADAAYHVESMAALGLKAVVRAASRGLTHIDRIDLASASARRKFAKLAAEKTGVAQRKVESHLATVAVKLDELDVESAAEESKGRACLTESDEAVALNRLRNENVLAEISGAITDSFGFIGEEENKRLAVLVAASRLLPQPLGAILRGPAGCGKSELLRCVTRALPSSEVLNFSRLTPQALYFMPRESLQHRVLAVDEYEGLIDAEYSLRTMMSSQSLSLAITVREGGRVPVTKTVEIPATLAVMVSTTQAINVENLSRFIELRMDDSAEQTRRVMAAMASGRVRGGLTGERRRRIDGIRNMSRLLKPCTVEIPFAEKLLYSSMNVLARRQFSQVVGLVSAHAALNQHQRSRDDSGELPVITATKADYEAVYPLLGHVIETFEEEVSPSALELLDRLEGASGRYYTRKDMMERCGWSYSKVHRTLKELESLDLVVPDKSASGVERTYEIAPYFRSKASVSQIAPPAAI